MPKPTVAALETRIAQLERLLSLRTKPIAPVGACHVFVGTRKAPYLTALSHSAAYNFMKLAKESGVHSHYKPV